MLPSEFIDKVQNGSKIVCRCNFRYGSRVYKQGDIFNIKDHCLSVRDLTTLFNGRRITAQKEFISEPKKDYTVQVTEQVETAPVEEKKKKLSLKKDK